MSKTVVGSMQDGVEDKDDDDNSVGCCCEGICGIGVNSSTHA
jgi:hypothetical protein